MLPVSISSSGSDESSVELFSSSLLTTSSLSSDSSINCFFKTFSDLVFFLFLFICFFLLQFLQYRFLRNNLNKKLHHCTVTNCKSYYRAIMNRLLRLYMYVYVYVYRALCFFNIRQAEGKIWSFNIRMTKCPGDEFVHTGIYFDFLP